MNFKSLIKERKEQPLTIKRLKVNQFTPLLKSDHPEIQTFVCPIRFHDPYEKMTKTFIVEEDTLISKNFNLVVPKGAYVATSMDPMNAVHVRHYKTYMVEPYRYYCCILKTPLTGIDKYGRITHMQMIIFDDFKGGRLVDYNYGSKTDGVYSELREAEEYPGMRVAMCNVDEENNRYRKDDRIDTHMGIHKLFFSVLNDVDSSVLCNSIDKKGNSNLSSDCFVTMHLDDNIRNCVAENLSCGTPKDNGRCSEILKEEFLNTVIHLDNGKCVTVKDMIMDTNKGPYSEIKKEYTALYNHVKKYGYAFEHIMDFELYKNYLASLENK